MNKKKLKEILKDSKKSFSVKRDNSAKIVNKDFIKELRIKRDYTQVVFASIIGVSVKTIEKWEQGSIEPRPMVKKFLYLLNMHPVLFSDLYSFESHEKTDNHTGLDTFDIEVLKDKLMKVGKEELEELKWEKE